MLKNALDGQVHLSSPLATDQQPFSCHQAQNSKWRSGVQHFRYIEPVLMLYSGAGIGGLTTAGII